MAVKSMHRVTYPVASWDKRFMRMIGEGEMISEKESAQLWRLFVKYRRQTGYTDKHSLMAYAKAHAAPDLRKVEAARREQERIDELKRQAQTT